MFPRKDLEVHSAAASCILLAQKTNSHLSLSTHFNYKNLQIYGLNLLALTIPLAALILQHLMNHC